MAGRSALGWWRRWRGVARVINATARIVLGFMFVIFAVALCVKMAITAAHADCDVEMIEQTRHLRIRVRSRCRHRDTIRQAYIGKDRRRDRLQGSLVRVVIRLRRITVRMVLAIFGTEVWKSPRAACIAVWRVMPDIVLAFVERVEILLETMIHEIIEVVQREIVSRLVAGLDRVVHALEVAADLVRRTLVEHFLPRPRNVVLRLRRCRRRRRLWIWGGIVVSSRTYHRNCERQRCN